MQRDRILEHAQARHDAIEAIVKAIDARARARQKLAEAEADLRGEIANAVYGVGLRQAEVANALGWPRQRVHAILADDSGIRKRLEKKAELLDFGELKPF
jgi:hypothetical protein